MKKITLIIVSAILAGTVWWSFDHHHPQIKQTTASVEATSPTSGTTTTDFLVPVKQTSFTPSINKQGESDIQATAEAFNKARGRDLITDIESFWHRCSLAENCDVLLDKLALFLTPERFYLIENYQQLSSQWKRTLGDLLFDEQISLAARIEQLKAEARRVWGQLADVMFEDEFALYDFTIQSKHLNMDAPEYISAEDYIQNFEDLMKTWQDRAESLGLVSNQAKFEQAVELVPDNLSESERDALISELEHHFLTPQQSAEIATRQQQVTQQQAVVSNYQSELQRLEASLEQQRVTQFSGLSQDEWQLYYAQQVADFRRAFFSQ
ncbi:chromosome partitioning protein ParA [Vibrio barjaei]|uniref:Chromosome partitioning protein ParA n=1 Tax=Vibrio barjaei TaxID=1676683 RepID=A0ABW7IQA7_9VIBR